MSPLLALLAACNGEPGVDSRYEETGLVNPDLTVFVSDGPEADSVSAGSEDIRVGCIEIAFAADQAVEGLLFKDLGLTSPDLGRTGTLKEGETELATAEAGGMGELGFTGLNVSDDAELCVHVNFGITPGTSQYGLEAPDAVETEGTVGGEFPAKFDAIQVE